MSGILETLQRALDRPLVPQGRTRIRDALLLAWFVALAVPMIIRPVLAGLAHPLGIDAIVYTNAARALLEDGNPWRTGVFGITFAAPPPSMLPYLPLVWLPDVVLGALGVIAAAASAVYAIRALGLPWWWLLFPPILLGIVAGSSALPMLALLVRGGAVSHAAAYVTRIYAAVPLLVLGRWQGLVMGAAVILVTAPFVGWVTYFAERDHIAAVFDAQAGSGSSAAAVPLLIPWVAMLLILVGRRRAAWLLVPMLWPNAQLHYASIALPVLSGMPLVAGGLAADSALLGIGSLTAHVALGRLRRRGMGPGQQRDEQDESPGGG